jgi:Na+-translocating ferredoxin:NAD+ oxidoreductase RnfC subunit
VRGLGAALVATGAQRGVLAVRRDFRDAIAAARAATRKSAIEVVLVEPYYPVDELLPVELALPGAAVLSARALADLERAMRGQPVVDRWITIAGAVARPRVCGVPIGAPIAAIVDTDLPAYVALDRALRGRLLTAHDVVDRETSGLLVVPPGHVLARAEATREGELMRARSACLDCRACSDACPHALAGAPLLPHLALRVLCHPQAEVGVDAGTVGGCTGCGVCDLACPAGLHPRALVRELAAALTAAGLPAAGEQPAAPHPDRAGRRLDLDLLRLRLDLARFPRALAFDRVPTRVPFVRLDHPPALPVWVGLGEQVVRGQPIAPGIAASIDGEVAELEPDYVLLRAR